MLFVDDIVLLAETREDVSNKLDEWKAALEGKGLRISRTKIEYLRCDFSRTAPVGEPEVSIGEAVVKGTDRKCKSSYTNGLAQVASSHRGAI